MSMMADVRGGVMSVPSQLEDLGTFFYLSKPHWLKSKELVCVYVYKCAHMCAIMHTHVLLEAIGRCLVFNSLTFFIFLCSLTLELTFFFFF